MGVQVRVLDQKKMQQENGVLIYFYPLTPSIISVFFKTNSFYYNYYVFVCLFFCVFFFLFIYF